MKTNTKLHIPGKTLGSSLYLMGLTAILTLSPAALTAQVVADFAGGGSHQNQVNNVVDAYRGMVGEGWTNRWVLRNNYGSGSMGSVAVVNGGTLWSGNRLQLTPSNNATGTGFGVSRTYSSYGSMDITKPVRISFQVSIEDLGTFLDTSRNEIFIGENNTDSMNRTGTTSWYVQAFGGNDPDEHLTRPGYETARQMQWNFGNGDLFVPTGIILQTNVLYSFEVNLNPANYTYTVKLSDGTTTFISEILGFRSEEALGRTLAFGQLYSETEGATWSFGHISIIPEPTTTALVAMGTILLVFTQRRKFRRQI